MPRTRRYGKKWRLEPCWRVRDTAAFLTTVDFFHDLRGLRHLQLTFYALRPTAPMNCEPHKLTGPCIILRRQLNVEKIPIGPLPPPRHPAEVVHLLNYPMYPPCIPMYPELPWIHECIQCIQTPGSCIYHLGFRLVEGGAAGLGGRAVCLAGSFLPFRQSRWPRARSLAWRRCDAFQKVQLWHDLDRKVVAPAWSLFGR